MKLLTLLSLLAVCMLVPTEASQRWTRLSAQEKGVSKIEKGKNDGIKYDMDYLEKSYGIKFKSAKFQMGSEGATLVTITLEFTKDLAENHRDVLAARFAGKSVQQPAALPDSSEQLIVLCYLFDEDSVAFTKQPPGKIEGEMTGKKGDAFRIIQTVPGDVLAKTKVISFRDEKGPPKK